MDKQISTKDQFRLWGHVAAHSFGGPAGQIAVIHKLVVEDKKLISEERFLHALNFCMLLPGPEAQQLATYMGWLMNRWRGGLIAGGLFILPGFLSILALSYLYVIFNDSTVVQGIFYGMKPAIFAIVLAALLRIASKALVNRFHRVLALCAFVAIFFFNLPFPLIIVVAAVMGIFLSGSRSTTETQNLALPSTTQTLLTLTVWLGIWITPIILTAMMFGTDSTFHQMNLFFSKMAMVTFGGAYAVLSYVAQMAVNVYGWVLAPEMLDGLAMAETTPGPLIQTVQFVGFMGAFRFPDVSSPYLAALIASILTTWMTFAPCFLWIFTFAPYVEFIREKKIFADALKGISAAVVGVICNLSLWFMLKTLFTESARYQDFALDFEYPLLSSLDPYASAICLIAMALQFRFKRSLFQIIATSMIIGIIVRFIM
mgnify:CR=1 FL=1